MFGEELDSGSGGTLLELDTSQPEYTPQEKAALEKEYLGVALSYNPLLALAALNPGDAYVSVDQLSEDMLGSAVTLLGHISAVSERYTRDNRKFLRVDLSMVGGQVETMVWPDVLEKTEQVWQAGSIARATGRLQIRGDDFSIACYEAQEYQLPDQQAPDLPAESPHTVPVGGNANGHHERANSVNGNGRKPSSASVTASVNGNGHTGKEAGVLIKMAETDDTEEDRYRLRQAIRVMLEYTGDDRVYLELFLKEGRRVLMEIPTVSTGSCDELQKRLRDLLGEDCAEYRASIA